MKPRHLWWTAALGLLVALIVCIAPALAQDNQIPQINLPTINISTDKTGQGLAAPMQVLLLMTILSLAPYILIMSTAFIRIAIVLSFLKTAMGTQQVPPTQVLMALALFMTMFVMQPVGQRINDRALQPYFHGKIKQDVFFKEATAPLKDFMYANTRHSDLVVFFKFQGENVIIPKINSSADVPLTVMLPAWVVSEVKTAFAIGFLLYIPFLVIDMVVASVLMSMGMFMLSPMTISLPFKLLLFVMIDGWEVVITGLIHSFKRPVWSLGPPS